MCQDWGCVSRAIKQLSARALACTGGLWVCIVHSCGLCVPLQPPASSEQLVRSVVNIWRVVARSGGLPPARKSSESVTPFRLRGYFGDVGAGGGGGGEREGKQEGLYYQGRPS